MKRLNRRLCVAVAAACAAACAGPPAPPKPVPRAVEPPRTSLSELPDRNFGVAVSRRFFIALPIPDADNWRVDDERDRWFVASHLPSKSMIWARSWREGSIVNHQACETVARKWRRDLFGTDESALTDRRPLSVPEGFDTEVGFAVHRVKGALGGVAVAVGANIRKCLVVAYATRVEGPGADRVLAERLAFVTDKILSRMTSVTVEDRAVGEKR